MKGRFIGLRMWLLGKLQKQCTHPPDLVSYDIADGTYSDPVSWCRICGAVHLKHDVHFANRPRADFWIEDMKRIAARSTQGEGESQ